MGDWRDKLPTPVAGKPTPEQIEEAAGLVEYWAEHYDGEFSTSDRDRETVKAELDFVLSVIRSLNHP